MQRQWEIAPGARTCHACGRPFGEDETFWSAIYETPDGEFERRDYCDPCKVKAEGPFSAWKTVNRPLPRLPRLSIDPAAAIELWEGLVVEKEDPARQKLAYLLSLLLMRRKLVRYAGTRDGFLVVRRTGRRKTWKVREFQFTVEELREMQAEIAALLDLDLASAAQEGAAPAPVEPASRAPERS